MKVVRILIYEGDEKVVEDNLNRTYISPTHPYGGGKNSSLTIREVFRGEAVEQELLKHSDGSSICGVGISDEKLMGSTEEG